MQTKQIKQTNKPIPNQRGKRPWFWPTLKLNKAGRLLHRVNPFEEEEALFGCLFVWLVGWLVVIRFLGRLLACVRACLQCSPMTFQPVLYYLDMVSVCFVCCLSQPFMVQHLLDLVLVLVSPSQKDLWFVRVSDRLPLRPGLV